MRSRFLSPAALTLFLALSAAPFVASFATAQTQTSPAQSASVSAPVPVSSVDKLDTISVSDIQPGMKGVAYTIFSGDTVEPMDLQVIGVLHNALGPKQDIILVQLLGEKVDHTGVVAGMSGSPVYLNGKLAGALSMKLGIFSKEAIGGVTPIANMLEVAKVAAQPPSKTDAAIPPPNSAAIENPGFAAPNAASIPAPPTYFNALFAAALPQNLVSATATPLRAPLDAQKFLIPIETPLIFSGIAPQLLEPFTKAFSSLGISPVSAIIGGTSPASPADRHVNPGDMIGMTLVAGGLSL